MPQCYLSILKILVFFKIQLQYIKIKIKLFAYICYRCVLLLHNAIFFKGEKENHNILPYLERGSRKKSSWRTEHILICIIVQIRGDSVDYGPLMHWCYVRIQLYRLEVVIPPKTVHGSNVFNIKWRQMSHFCVSAPLFWNCIDIQC